MKVTSRESYLDSFLAEQKRKEKKKKKKKR
jgi:hypothetical protein